MQREEGAVAHKIKLYLRTIRLAIVVLVVISLALLVFFNIDAINMDNFRRLLAKIDFSVNQTGTVGSGSITFTGDTLNCYDVYKGGLAVLSPDGLKVYDEKGNEFTGLQAVYKKPTMQATKKYILTFDRGGDKLIISNSFTIVFSKTFANKILNASMAEDGSFVVTTECEGYKALITVFDSSFKEKFKLYSAEKYIIDAKMNSNNGILAIASIKTGGGEISSAVTLYKIGTDKPFFEFPIADCTPFEIEYKSNGNICIFADKKAIFINRDGKKEGEVDYSNKTLTTYATNNGKYTAFILTVGRTATIMIVDEKGNAWTNGTLDGLVTSASFSDNGLVLLQKNNILLADFVSKNGVKIKKTIPVESGIEQILAGSKNVFAIKGSIAEIFDLN
jgi:hypothetical protein